MDPMPQELGVRGETPNRRAVVLHIVREIDRVRAAREGERLGDGETHAHRSRSAAHAACRFAGRHHIGRGGRFPNGEMCGRGFAGGADEPGLQHVQGVVTVAVFQTHRHIGCVLVQRILSTMSARSSSPPFRLMPTSSTSVTMCTCSGGPGGAAIAASVGSAASVAGAAADGAPSSGLAGARRRARRSGTAEPVPEGTESPSRFGADRPLAAEVPAPAVAPDSRASRPRNSETESRRARPTASRGC